MIACVEKWKIRSAEPNDINFIYSTFLKALKADSSLGKSVRNSVFFDEYQSIADSILEHAIILVACNHEDNNTIFGYLVYDPTVMHFAFTKAGFQRLGIAKSLCLAAEHKSGKFKYYTHKTHNALPILKKHEDLIFNPFILYQSTKGEAHEQEGI